ncbi:reverse transcriptase family protein [Microlunatus parietis]|uniref:RNA-directed DNA polymerase n=1 Tax=Microlunatus parietis TaxID=682979 RepID=A0A7Y9L9K1_9ACTN|nr:reverse transcriptase family protein [Microlunatus parietis]NYE71879.1 hypothetical protein [Microlunatus parietis]
MAVTVDQIERMMGVPPGTLDKTARILEAETGFTILRIPSRRGRFRRVVRLTTTLDSIIKGIRRSLEAQLSFVPRDCVHGCVKQRGILTNARAHVGKKVVLRIDIRRFFESISVSQVEDALRTSEADPESSALVARCTTLGGFLPVGFSTSPLLANMIFDGTDALLGDCAKSYSLSYTRYVDDLSFSGEHLDDQIRLEIEGVLRSQGWEIQDRKTRFMRAGHAQYVTGLSVNDPNGPHIPRNMKRFLRLEVHHVVRSGFGASVLGKRKLLGHINHVKHVDYDLGLELHDAIRSAGLLVGRPDDESPEDGLELFWEDIGIDF